MNQRRKPQADQQRMPAPDDISIRELDAAEFDALTTEWFPRIFDAHHPMLRPIRTPDADERRQRRKRELDERAWALRLAISVGGEFAGWTAAIQQEAEVIYMRSSAILPRFRRHGLYTRLLAEVERRAINDGFELLQSHHNPANVEVLIAKLKAGFVVSGFRVMDIVGPTVELTKMLVPDRHRAMMVRLSREFADERIARCIGPQSDVSGATR